MNAVGGTFAIKGVVPEVMEVFELAGFTDIIKFIQ
jgi:anti-anti-sigma regulatory factor